MAASKAPARKSSGPVVSPSMEEVKEYVPGQESWEEIVQTADQAIGHDLAKDELLDALVGVPFLVTRLTFRRGIPKPGVKFHPAYVSVEGVIAPEHVLKRRRVNMENLPFEPEAQIIFNDGSTGIYRQMVAYLAGSRRIELPEGAENGPFGETVFDLPPNEWKEIHAGTITFGDDGWADYEVNVRLTCPRGLRLSSYENDYNPNGSTTRYVG